MRLDPRHFHRFMAITAVMSMAAIAWFTIRHQRVKQAAFEASIEASFPAWWARAASDPESLPSLEVPLERDDASSSAPTSSVIIFWAPWSERSVAVLGNADRALRALGEQPDGTHHPVRLVALGIKDAPQAMRDVASTTGINAEWLDGTKAYADLAVPGIPTMILLDAAGAVTLVDVGVDPDKVAGVLSRALH